MIGSLLILSSLLSSPSAISSKKASFDGNTLNLQGNVSLEHTLGHLSSKSAQLDRDSKDGPYSRIQLSDDVTIALNNKGKITCAKADFDFTQLKGKLTPAKGKTVHFTHLHSDLFSLSAAKADLSFTKQSDDFQIDTIVADGMIHAQYGYDLFLTADTATYLAQPYPHFLATPNCHLIYRNDAIDAEKIELFPESAKIVLSSPSGTVSSSLYADLEAIAFSCDKMIWDHGPEQLTLRGNVHFDDQSIGSLFCDDEVEFFQEQKGGRWQLKEMHSKGTTTFRYQKDYALTCKGNVSLDQKSLTLSLTPEAQTPIEYIHEGLCLLADDANIQYEQQGQKIVPKLVTLHGHVRLKSQTDNNRCALAERLTYAPQTDTMTLYSSDQTPVLFWDDSLQLSISAKQIIVKKQSGEDSVRGVGNVRFHFSSAESSLLKEVFPFYKLKEPLL